MTATCSNPVAINYQNYSSMFDLELQADVEDNILVFSDL